MPKTILTIVATLVLLGAYFMYQRRNAIETLSPESPTNSHSESVAKKIPSSSAILIRKSESSHVTKPGENPYRTESDVVPFVIEKGLAIAMGDLILGTPEDETLKSGQYKMPVPQYWDKPDIPYLINADVKEPARVTLAMKHIQGKTGLRFVQHTDQPDVVVFMVGDEHCQSALGRVGGIQPIRICEECTWHEIVHELLHAVGFIHEQSRSDRDSFVKIDWDNIAKKYWPQFAMLPADFSGPAKDTGFDYQSIMLYDPTMFAKNESLPTMSSTSGTPIQPSPRGLSAGDVDRIKKWFRLE